MSWHLETRFTAVIKQQQEGIKYFGTLSIGGRIFDWRIEFPIPLQKIRRNTILQASIDEIVKIAIYSSGQVLQMDDHRFGTFAFLTMPVIDFYFDPVSQAFNSVPNPQGKTLQKIIQETIGLTEEAIATLSHPDTGCHFFEDSLN